MWETYLLVTFIYVGGICMLKTLYMILFSILQEFYKALRVGYLVYLLMLPF